MKLYRLLLRLFPARFREEYEAPMEHLFSDEYRDATGVWSRTRLWSRAIGDVIVSAPQQRLSELTLDLSHAARIYRKHLFSTMLALTAMALAIGASTGVFSVLSAVLLRSLPFADPEELTRLWLPPVSALSGRAAFSDWYRHSAYLANAAAISPSEMNLTGEREAFRVKVAETSSNFFQLLGTNSVIGRTFAPDEDIPGHNEVAVISYGLWQQRFGGAPEIAGSVLHLNGARFTIIGVAPATFDFPGKTAIWLPTVFDFEKVPHRGALFIETIGRLKPGVTVPMAQQMFDAEIRRIPERLRSLIPGEPGPQNRPRLESLQNHLAGPVRQATWVLAGMTLLVLLTACGNVAQLLLSRTTTERTQELAVRAALGASPSRLLQQLITEATFLTILGAMLGVLVAHWTAKIASAVAPAQLAAQEYTVLDWRVLGFAAALAVVIGIVFGVFPALFVSQLQPYGRAIQRRHASGSVGTKTARAALVAVQAALTLCLLTSAFALGLTFLRLLKVDLGFQTANTVTLNVSLQGTRRNGSAEWQYYRDALDRLRSIPGVISAGGISYLPLADNVYMGGDIKMDSGQTIAGVITNAVTHDYFRTVGTAMVAGRDFADSEMKNSDRSVIVNEAFSENSGFGNRIIGRKLTPPWGGAEYTVAGVVGTERVTGPVNVGGPQIYWPIEEEPPPALTLVARVHGKPEDSLAKARDAVRAVDTQVPVYDVKTLDQRLSDVLARPRFYTISTLFLSGLAILLSVIGIYGTAAHSIAQRRQEMGVRLAIGASTRRVREMLLFESLAPIVLGTLVGVVVAIIGCRFLGYLVENSAQPALWTCLYAAALLLCAGAFAAWRATAKVLSIAPIEALRAE